MRCTGIPENGARSAFQIAIRRPREIRRSSFGASDFLKITCIVFGKSCREGNVEPVRLGFAAKRHVCHDLLLPQEHSCRFEESRGATSVDEDSADAVLTATGELLQEILDANGH